MLHHFNKPFSLHIAQNSNTQLSFTFFIHIPIMTNLDSIFKSRDITLPIKVRLVKAMVFPVVMYGCESWDCEEG